MPQTTDTDYLNGVRAFVAAGWTQVHFFADSGDNAVTASDPTRAKWSLEGALEAWNSGLTGVTTAERNALILSVRTKLKRAMYDQHGQWFGSIIQYNNTPGRTQAEVLAVIDKALTY